MKRYASLLLLGTLASAIGGALAAPTGPAAPAAPAASPKVQALLDVLNSAGGKRMEQLTPQQARKVLVDAQAGATLPAAEVTRKTITIDGKPLGLVVVKPPGSAGKT
ncbi:lipase [Xanthomonas campestris pv. campestris]|nr:lipase [Xanthomonas campestris pv. campestris]